MINKVFTCRICSCFHVRKRNIMFRNFHNIRNYNPENWLTRYQLLSKRRFAKEPRVRVIKPDLYDDSDVGALKREVYLKQCQDERIIFNSILDDFSLRKSHYERRDVAENLEKEQKHIKFETSVPLIVEKYVRIPVNQSKDAINNEIDTTKTTLLRDSSLPFSNFESIDLEFSHESSNKNEEVVEISKNTSKNYIKDDIAYRLKAYDENNFEPFKEPSTWDPANPEEELYNETLLKQLESNTLQYKLQYGTPDISIPPSNVQCGGCGAFLHCQDEALPGYCPSEKFTSLNKIDLRSLLCQRCHFLRHHNMALNVRVSPEVYEQALYPIQKTSSLIVVVLDILDIPCSIWPGLVDLLGTERPVVVVANKVDLLPPDGVDFLRSARESVENTVRKSNLGLAKIVHLALVSAKTGYGIEDLITNIQIKWGTRGDIYLLGCTNAGKSSLFNAFLGSDMCKVKASDLIEKATASPWPGTTLNMLKFPLLRPTGLRLSKRRDRIANHRELELKEVPDTKTTNDFNVATLSGHIGKSFHLTAKEIVEEEDPFSMRPRHKLKDTEAVSGIDDKCIEYKDSKWCYDTPGTVQPDQMLGLLSHEELVKVLPRTIIEPKTFTLHSCQTLLIAAIARIDLLYCEESVRFTVYASPQLPITVCSTVDCSSLIRDYLGTDLFAIPCGPEKRLKKWPVLKPASLYAKANLKEEAITDIVLSSAGLVTLSARNYVNIDLRAWTPGGRGIYTRMPMLLKTPKLRGTRIKDTPTYGRHKVYVVRHREKEILA